jgi:hypothetical protein
MARCDICGTEFDPLGFQVVVPELGAGFDRVECARQARRLAPAGAPPAILPLAAIAEPVPAFAPAALPLLFDGDRRPAFGVAALGLLAAATAASVFVWVRILGADPSGFSLPGSLAPSAVERRAVAAEIVAGPETQRVPAVTRPETAPTRSLGDDVAPPTSAPAPPAVVGGPIRIPTVPTRSVDDTPTRTSDAPATLQREGATKHGAGKPGRAQAHGHGQGHGQAQGHGQDKGDDQARGHGQGKGHGHGKGHGQGKGHEQGHGHGKGKKLGHSEHGHSKRG